MLTIDAAQAVLKKAQEAGATDGDILIQQGETFEGAVRLGKIEQISGARSKQMTLRLFFGKRSAITSTSDWTPPSLAAFLSDTCSLARLSPEDPYAGLPAPHEIATDIPCFDLFDAGIQARSIDEKIDLAERAEKAAFAADPRITNSDGAHIEHGTHTVLYAATNGFSGSYTHGAISLSVVPVASEKGLMQRDFWYSTRRKYQELQSPEAVGAIAAARAARRLGGRSVATQEVPVVFDAEISVSLLSHLASALSGYALYRKASFLVDQLGVQVASEEVTIEDDPTLPGALGTRPFDGEGLPSQKKMVIEKGILRTYLLDTYSGKKMGLPSTGNASSLSGGARTVGPANFHMRPGRATPEEIIRSVKRGLYVTELIGFGVNTVTGDYSQGAAGFWIENGVLAFPVEEVTIAGNLKEMLLHVEQVGNDLESWKKMAAPTIKIARMTVAGKGGNC